MSHSSRLVDRSDKSYSTCVGRISKFKGKNRLGIVPHYAPTPGLLSLVKTHLNGMSVSLHRRNITDEITVSPNGFMFVKPHIRKSLLAKMLEELLDTRVMVKGSMKLAKDDKVGPFHRSAR